MPSRSLMTAMLLSVPAVLTAGAAAADARYEMETTESRSGDTVTNEILVKDGMLRMSVQSPRGDDTDVIYLPAREQMVMIDHKRREVRRMSKADMERMQGMMAGMTQQMQDALKDMPPEARAQAEKMMKKQMGQAGMGQKAETTVEPMGESGTVAGIDCDMYAMMRNGTRTQEFCAANAGDIEGGDELVAAMGGMAEFMKGFTEAMGGMGGSGLDAYFEPVKGKFPVSAREVEGGRVVSETKLVTVEEVSLGDDQFNPPKGYRERKLME